MGIFDFFKDTTTKNPTIKNDAIAYTAGAGKEFSDDYNDFISSVETIDKAIRIASNVASMAKIEVLKEVNGKLKPLKIKDVDLAFNINEVDSQSYFIRKSFSSLLSQGAAIILAEKSRETGFIGFYPYNPAKFSINATEKSVLSEFVYETESGEEMIFKPKDVILFALHNCQVNK